MPKLLLCLFGAFAIGVATLQLRQQNLELRHRAATLHQKIESQQAKLWTQQLQIAVYTAPNAIPNTVAQHRLELVPQANLPESAGRWIEQRKPVVRP